MGAEEYVPDKAGIQQLRKAVHDCRGCDLYKNATQAVFGEGPADAAVLVVGEVPGDQEDRQGHPFVGPAGKLLDKALVEAGIDRTQVYVTNAVKHFKYKPAERGKRRIHQKPGRTEVVACRPWLIAELDTVRPDLVVLLGATAAQSLLGTTFKVTQERGKVVELPDRAERAVATVHPSSVLRSDDREAAYRDLVADLRSAASVLSGRQRTR
ncbi:UdgX family uracil-DNA binding protein [Actinophytocola algeriensis]|uniref:Type-4 uracil-DNA glycosylase n=1 Tax=Actinophytocola algeriensis TaxID=1768010 RepID=A0A7W7VHC2_9PSEU|nr:UdgX family uracil-DNA binding protein [Actinophytocola algeriensis]MBB4909930.1 DNA polymerase [Actinophytocola algeriensis]MBE1475920.1 DNA polymerase [Actinophytocola algeriensis]